MNRRAFIKRNGLWVTGALAFPAIVRAQVMLSARHIAAPKPAANTDTLLNGLVGWWKLDENTGTTANDSSPTGANGTITSGAWATGQFSSGYGWSGSQFGNISTTDNSHFNLNDLSISFWYNSSTTTNNHSVCTKWKASEYQFQIRIVASTGKYSFYTFQSGGSVYQSATNGASIATGSWVNIIGTLAGTTMKLFTNGGADGTGGSTTGTRNTTGTGNFYVCGDSLAGFTMDHCLIDDIRIWNRALTSGEITQLQSQA